MMNSVFLWLSSSGGCLA